MEFSDETSGTSSDFLRSKGFVIEDLFLVKLPNEQNGASFDIKIFKGEWWDNRVRAGDVSESEHGWINKKQVAIVCHFSFLMGQVRQSVL